jgi:CRP-like cAMP-binding protein
MISPERLRRFSYCAGASDDLLKQVAMLASEKPFDVGEHLFEEGASARRLMMLESGSVDIVHTLGNGQSVVVDTLVGGDLMAWSALLEPHVLTATGIGRTAGRVVEIEGEGLRRLCRENPHYGLPMMTEVAKTLRARLDATRVQLAAA